MLNATLTLTLTMTLTLTLTSTLTLTLILTLTLTMVMTDGMGVADGHTYVDTVFRHQRLSVAAVLRTYFSGQPADTLKH